MPLIKLEYNPGIIKDQTEYAVSGYWFDSNCIRFRAGRPESIGGWQSVTSQSFVGTCRALFPWSALSGTRYCAVGTHVKYYVYEGGGFTDITPLRDSGTLALDPISTTDGSNLVTVTNIGHGLQVGDYITLSGATSVGGISASAINREHTVYQASDANSYVIQVSETATTSASGGGSLVTYAYQITSGLDTVTFGRGWGAGHFGRGTFGSPATTETAGAQLRLWTQQNYGEDLVLCPRDGAIYVWDHSSGGRAGRLGDEAGALAVPIVTTEVAVSNERHVVAFGTNPFDSLVQDKMLVRWSDSAQRYDWLPTTENSAGSLRLSHGSEFITHQQVGRETLIWTDTSLHAMRYVGDPYVYGIDMIAAKVTIMGPKAKAVVGDLCFWMGDGKFYIYNGQIAPLQCPVEDFVFSSINRRQSFKVFAGTCASHNEVFFFYPADGSSEVNRYVKYNYVDQVFDVGSLARTAWVDRSVFTNPIAAATDGKLYFHEVGHSDGSTNPPSRIDSYITAAPIEIEGGERFMFMSKVIPDISFRNSDTSSPTAVVTIYPKDYPGVSVGTADGGTIAASVPVTEYTKEIDVRVRARSVLVKFETGAAGTAWRIGVPRVLVRQDGMK